MKLTLCEFPDEVAHKERAWDSLVEHTATEKPDIVVLPEMPFCDWIFVGDAVDLDRWRDAIARHERMIDRFDELGSEWVVGSSPVDRDGRRQNEAFLWSKAAGYREMRRKWYLPDVPTARETVWFHRGDRDFTPISCGPVRFGVVLCSEIMFPEHAREIGFADAHLIVHPRASGNGKRWRVACEMSAISSGSFVVSANRRSYGRDLFSGGSWLLTPEAASLGETTAEQPFVTVAIDTTIAEKAKTTYPRDLQRMYCKT